MSIKISYSKKNKVFIHSEGLKNYTREQTILESLEQEVIKLKNKNHNY